jgi:hypothetical protein
LRQPSPCRAASAYTLRYRPAHCGLKCTTRKYQKGRTINSYQHGNSSRLCKGGVCSSSSCCPCISVQLNMARDSHIRYRSNLMDNCCNQSGQRENTSRWGMAASLYTRYYLRYMDSSNRLDKYCMTTCQSRPSTCPWGTSFEIVCNHTWRSRMGTSICIRVRWPGTFRYHTIPRSNRGHWQFCL